MSLNEALQDFSIVGDVISWSSIEDDFARIEQVAHYFDNSDLSDDAFRLHVPEIIDILLASSFFSRLSFNLPKKPGIKEPTIQHIQKALMSIDTEVIISTLIENGVDEETANSFYKPIFRWVVFFHDLAKAVSPLDDRHEIRSALIARRFFEHCNTEPNEAVYSEEFIVAVGALCKNHHLFQRISEHYSIDDEHPDSIQINNLKEFETVVSWELDDIGKIWLWFLYLFTIVDAGTNEKYQKYIVKNHFLMRVILENFFNEEL